MSRWSPLLSQPELWCPNLHSTTYSLRRTDPLFLHSAGCSFYCFCHNHHYTSLLCTSSVSINCSTMSDNPDLQYSIPFVSMSNEHGSLLDKYRCPPNNPVDRPIFGFGKGMVGSLDLVDLMISVSFFCEGRHVQHDGYPKSSQGYHFFSCTSCQSWEVQALCSPYNHIAYV
jgi:hypothetical protein